MQDFEEEKQEKEKAMKHLQEVEERNSSAAHKVKKSPLTFNETFFTLVLIT